MSERIVHIVRCKFEERSIINSNNGLLFILVKNIAGLLWIIKIMYFKITFKDKQYHGNSTVVTQLLFFHAPL